MAFVRTSTTPAFVPATGTFALEGGRCSRNWIPNSDPTRGINSGPQGAIGARIAGRWTRWNGHANTSGMARALLGTARLAPLDPWHRVYVYAERLGAMVTWTPRL